MADKYLVPCSCGKTVAVAVNQAGSKVLCECGSQVGVPPLRKLRELPRDHTEIATQRNSWTARHAVATAGTILATILAVWSTWLWATEPALPKFDQIYEEHLEASADNMLAEATPADFWKHLQITSPILLERGFEEISTPQEEGFVQYLEDRHLRRNLTFAAAGLVAAISAVVWLFWPKPLA